MNLTRRNVIFAGLGGVAAMALPFEASAAALDAVVKEFTGGAAPGTDGITLTAPEIAENGNTVPVAVDAPGATEIMLVAEGNPEPGVATFKFGPASGSQSVATRIRLAKTQSVTAYAKMADGSIKTAQSTVKVTIGGCGG